MASTPLTDLVTLIQFAETTGLRDQDRVEIKVGSFGGDARLYVRFSEIKRVVTLAQRAKQAGL